MWVPATRASFRKDRIACLHAGECALRKRSIVLVRLPANRGISAARNEAIGRSAASLLACINAEVVPDEDWLATCKNYLFSHHDVGACYTRIVPQRPNRMLTRWRMRFEETIYRSCTAARESRYLSRAKRGDRALGGISSGLHQRRSCA